MPAVEISTLVIFLLSSVLAFYLTKSYFQRKKVSYILWASGMWGFTLGVILEALFAFGVYDGFLINLYLFVVAILVELLASGSINLTGNRNAILAYYIYSLISAIALIVSLTYANIGYILTAGVVYGPLPLSVIIASSLVTFPAAAVLIIVAGASYYNKHSAKMVSIIAGTVVVSIAGTLYIAQFPAFLYYAEFVGIVLLWLGFFDFKRALHN
ncbi:MAG: hypothetical protein JRN26_00420 [Nitrososphaerota archaeon]|jgi:hypothetical protein|nr:hypothetical protein [Nitrososphaerota archaeon]MDG6927759.1 hypothetical protein [Nitrososphaerota archaeon]MDG6930298.1 hypothetical protein [Nitrososphaerota archaeon]MDG6932721.1 hypothetical protein [Nitrososphaerota archaeon]MDG6935344.1 hypothetical protein [Nitrososphaerota archaeon]